MSKFIRFIPATLLVLYLAAKVVPYIQKDTVDNSYEPTAEQKVLLGPVTSALRQNPSAAQDFESLYYGIALVVGSDEVVIKTTDEVRRVHENAGALAIQAGEIPRIPGYAEAVNNFIKSQLGTDNVPLDLNKKKQIIDTFKALAWATSQ